MWRRRRKGKQGKRREGREGNGREGKEPVPSDATADRTQGRVAMKRGADGTAPGRTRRSSRRSGVLTSVGMGWAGGWGEGRDDETFKNWCNYLADSPVDLLFEAAHTVTVEG